MAISTDQLFQDRGNGASATAGGADPQGHIQQRGKQSWRLKFDLGRDPATGKRLSRFVTFKGTKREAQAELSPQLITLDWMH